MYIYSMYNRIYKHIYYKIYYPNIQRTVMGRWIQRGIMRRRRGRTRSSLEVTKGILSSETRRNEEAKTIIYSEKNQ